MRIIIQFLLLILPWSIRRRLLNLFFHYKIDKGARIGLSIILSKNVEMRKGSLIGNLTFCGTIDSLVMDCNSKIGSLNYIAGFSTTNTKVFQNVVARKCEFQIGEYSSITSRHYWDVNGGIYIGKYVQVAGIRSTFLTHSIDIYTSTQTAAPIIIGDYCFIGSNSLMLKGAILHSFTVVAAGSAVTKSTNKMYTLIGGVPAIEKKDLKNANVGFFLREKGRVD